MFMQFLRVSSIESKSSHPMAAALVDYGRWYSIEPKPKDVEEFQNFPGQGIQVNIDVKNIYILVTERLLTELRNR
jgi:Cd2+/Zn2+-exporting ATPase